MDFHVDKIITKQKKSTEGENLLSENDSLQIL